MAGRGPAGKQVRSRDRDTQRRQAEMSDLYPDGEVRGPELPADYEWHARTVAWWEVWRRSPQAQTFTDTDWSFLLDTALMHSVMWEKGRWEFASELRLRAAKFGATVEDRLRLKLTVHTPLDEAPDTPVGEGSVTSIQSRRARLSS